MADLASRLGQELNAVDVILDIQSSLPTCLSASSYISLFISTMRISPFTKTSVGVMTSIEASSFSVGPLIPCLGTVDQERSYTGVDQQGLTDIKTMLAMHVQCNDGIKRFYMMSLKKLR